MVLPQDFFDPAPTHLPALHVTVDHSRRRKQAAPLRALDASHLPLDEIRPLVFTSVWQQVGAEIVPSPAEASQPARSASAIASTTRVHKIRRAAAQHKHYAFSKLAFDDDVFDVESTTTEGSSNDGDDDASRLRVAKFNIASVVLSKPARERAPKPEPAALPIKKPAEPRSFSSRKVCGCCRTTNTPLWRDIGKEAPLCNACGIRYKKYGLVCDSCFYVPCKSERAKGVCPRCTAVFPEPVNCRFPLKGRSVDSAEESDELSEDAFSPFDL
eukprot:m.156502 g.156502  ORF g.156502 m.156502 type:complete len:271 (+) comp52930_c0_seq4:278-1090(+)